MAFASCLAFDLLKNTELSGRVSCNVMHVMFKTVCCKTQTHMGLWESWHGEH